MISCKLSLSSVEGQKSLSSSSEIRWVGLCVGLGLGVFALDLTFLGGLTVGVLYAFIVLFASRFSYSHSAYVAAVLCSGFSLLSLGSADSSHYSQWRIGESAVSDFRHLGDRVSFSVVG